MPNGYPNPTRYPVFFSIPDPTRFSFENHRVAGNPKYRVLPDISGKPEVSGITRYFGYSQTWLGISGITPPQSWVLVGGKLFVNFCNVRKNLNVWLTTSKKKRWYPIYPEIPGNTQEYPEIPESKKDTRKYPTVYFNTPTRPEPDPLPGIFSNTRPDPTRYWKTLPVGHW